MGPLTCSAEALTVMLFLEGSPAQPAYYPSFDAAVAALVRGDINRVLLPHCHPFTNQLLFDERFEFDMGSGFDKRNPPIHLTRRPSTDSVPATLVGRCAALPTLWPLVSESTPTLTLVPAVSNPAAAKALADGDAEYAITNEASLSAFGLSSVRQLKEVIVRWFPVRLRRAAWHGLEPGTAGTQGGVADPHVDHVGDRGAP